MVTPLRTGPALGAADGADAATPIAPDQRAVVASTAPALRVTAPAGSGKTRTMVEWAVDRAHRLAADQGPGRSVLAVSFTNRATAELQRRVGAGLRRAGLPVDGVRVATFHALAGGILTEFGHHLGLAREPILLGTAEQHRLIETSLADVDFEAMDATWLRTAVVATAELASQLADHQVSVETAGRWHRQQLELAGGHADAVAGLRRKKDRDACTVAVRTLAERLDLLGAVGAFRAAKRTEGALDFADQLELAVRLLDLPAAAAVLRARHPYIVVDEYQDTNVAQRELLQRIADPLGGQLVVVGDDAQAIYRFRGATLDNFRSFADHFTGADDLALERVYRHGPEVIRVAETIVRRSRDWRPRQTTAVGSAASDVWVRHFADQGQEVEAITAHVLARVAAGTPARDIAVLSPQRRLLVPIARRLEAEGVAVEAPGLGNLLDSPTFHELLAALRLAQDPGDAMAAARLLRGPRYRLGPAELVSFVEAADAIAATERRIAGATWQDDVGVRLLDGLLRTTEAVTPEVAMRVDRFLDDVRGWATAGKVLPLGELVTRVADDLGVTDALATSPSAPAVRARSELVATVDAAEAYEAMGRGAGLAGFLAMVDRMLDEDENIEVAPPDPLSPAVRLLTIHSAKGLEFDHVVVTGLVDQALPNVRATGCESTRSGRASVPDDLRRDGDRRSPEPWDPAALASHAEGYRAEADDEQRRLFYVATTRARTSLLLTASTWVWGADGNPRKRPTKAPYLAELAEAGFAVEECGGPPPDANPLEPLVLFDPPPKVPPSALELDLVAGRPLAGGPHAAATVAVARDLLTREVRERAVGPTAPTEHTVTDLVLAARCRVAYARRRVLGLPHAPSAAARRGTLVHRWLEERAWALQEGHDPSLVARPWHAAALLPLLPSSGLGEARPVLDPEAGADAAVDDPAEPVASDAEADRLADRFVRSAYATRVPEAAELPLVLTVGGAFIRGAADFVYATAPDDGPGWEVVDLKTGPAPADEAGWLQLEAYALAIGDGGRRLEEATLTFLSLSGRTATVVSRAARPRTDIVRSLRELHSRPRPVPTSATAAGGADEHRRRGPGCDSRRRVRVTILVMSEPPSTADAAPLQVDAVLEVVLASAGRLFEAEGGSVMLLVGAEELEVVAAPTNPAALGARVRFGEGVAGKVAASCDPVLVTGRAGNRSNPVDSGMCVPLLHDGRIFGVLNVNARAGRTFTDSDLVAATRFAAHAANALASARLYEVDRREGANQPQRHLDEMLRHLHDASSVDFVHPGADEAVDLAAVARSVADAEDRAGRPTGVRGPASATIRGRSRELRWLLQELIDNGHRHGEAPVRIILEEDERDVVVTVADSGLGVPVPERTRVFEPYGRLDRDTDGAGLGLGLTIARRLAEAMHGTMSIMDTPVGGAAVQVRFPLNA